MAKQGHGNLNFSPAECLTRLPEIELKATEIGDDYGFKKANLKKSLLKIAELDHINETALVRKVIMNTLGKMPELDNI